MRQSLLLLAALLVLGCNSSSDVSTPTSPSTVQNIEVRLRPGQQTTALGALLHFMEVRNDSRCPVDVQCVWAGDAEVVFTAGPEATSIVLHAHGPGAVKRYNDLKLELISLEPAPRSGVAIEQRDYVATVRLSR